VGLLDCPEGRFVFDKVGLEVRLAKAEEHVAMAAQQAKRQRAIIADLVSKGSDTLEARLWLAQFEEIRELYASECKKLRKQLSTLT
jgi:hypothetical protein